MRIDRKDLPEPNAVDRIIGYFNPVAGARRYRARLAVAMAGGYTGASKKRRGLKAWKSTGNDPDTDILPDLPTLRDRSRDMVRNMPLASGAINTKVTNVVGTGLRLQSRIDRDALKMDKDAADAWEAKTEREWNLWWNNPSCFCDAARTSTGDDLTAMVYRQAKENGDVFVLLPGIVHRHFPYRLALQVIEADRVSNRDNAAATNRIAGGIKKNRYGAPIEYYVTNVHPGGIDGQTGIEWRTVPAYGATTGLKNIVHVFRPTRPGQTRGVPDLAAVIEPLKQLTRYTEAELMAAVVSGMFTVFVETESGDPTFDLSDTNEETGADTSDEDYKLGNGAIIGLAQGEKVHDTNPGRPNESFDPFVLAILRQIGVALELPFEILIKHFTASYSAARAAMLEAWKYFLTERKWLTDHFNRVVYEIWMWEAVSIGRIAAPGFLADPAVRQAYLGSVWTGPAKGQLKELDEVNAAEKRIDIGISNIQEETAQLTGGDWEKNHRQRVKEHNARKEDGLIVSTKPDDGTGDTQDEDN